MWDNADADLWDDLDRHLDDGDRIIEDCVPVEMNHAIIAPYDEVAPTRNQGTVPDDTPLQTRGHPNIKSNFDNLVPDVNGTSHKNPLVTHWNV